ncbi:MAG TPA: molybdopterin-dependent oxidoreductase [Acidimicrobiia bacterium]|nr:molybdopterin-dependent oxidoreductase [Acidimicrobiia bacterium]
MSVEERRSFCRICQALCGIVVSVDGDQVVKVKGDPDDPVSNGYTCPKGRSLGAFHHDPRRLDYPAIRANGSFERTTWPGLFGDLDARLTEIRDQHGPNAIGVYAATGAAFDTNGRRAAQRYLQAIGSKSLYSSGSIDAPAKPMIAEMMAGFAGVVPVPDREDPRLVLFAGCNPVVSHGHLNGFPDPVVAIRDLASRGEVWVLDPRVTETARLATAHVAARPGTDWVVFAYLVREILRDGADHRYLADHATGVDALGKAVEPFDAAEAASRSGVSIDHLEALLAAIRRAGRLAVQTGTGITMNDAANVTEWLAWSLQIITHSFDAPGGSWFNPGYVRALDGRSIAAGGGTAEPGPPSRPDLPRRIGEYPVAAMYDEIESGNLRALFVLGGNPITAFPDVDRTAKVMERLEVLALCDVVENETAPYATHLLPCTDQLERADIPLFVDQFAPFVMTRYAPAVVPPKAEHRPSWWQFAKLAERWGLDALGLGRPADELTDDDLLRVLGDRSRSSFDEIRAAGVKVHDEKQVFGWIHENVLPEGRWNVAPEAVVAQLAGLAIAHGADLALVPRRQVRHLNSQLTAGVGGRADPADVLIHPEDAASRGIADGMEVVVRSDHGSLTGVATVTDAIRTGAVSVPHGFGEPNIGTILSSEIGVDPLSGMVRLGAVSVIVEPAP